MRYTQGQLTNLRNDWKATLRKRKNTFTVRELRSIERNLGTNCGYEAVQQLAGERIPVVSVAARNVLINLGKLSAFPRRDVR